MHVSPPRIAAPVSYSIIDGQPQPDCGGLSGLIGGHLPDEEDQPERNFFFRDGTSGGRIRADLGRIVNIQEVDTYSWHSGNRAAQVYRLYASDASSPGFNAAPKAGVDPTQCGWSLVATVDTRTESKGRGSGGQYGVSILGSKGRLGAYRYLLFDVDPTETSDAWGNTFYSGINVIDADTVTTLDSALSPGIFSFTTEDGKGRITFDSGGSVELADWAHADLAPVLSKWYPKIAAMLSSDGFVAPSRYTIEVKPFAGVAYTAGTHICVAEKWLEKNLSDGEGVGCVVHETVHVVQQFGHGKPEYPAPVWLMEGSADYIRWFVYQPEAHGADAEWLRGHPYTPIRYDGSYRITANFLNWVSQTYDRDVVAQMNAAMREGRYTDGLWQKFTGKTAPQLEAEWKHQLGL